MPPCTQQSAFAVRGAQRWSACARNARVKSSEGCVQTQLCFRGESWRHPGRDGAGKPVPKVHGRCRAPAWPEGPLHDGCRPLAVSASGLWKNLPRDRSVHPPAAASRNTAPQPRAAARLDEQSAVIGFSAHDSGLARCINRRLPCHSPVSHFFNGGTKPCRCPWLCIVIGLHGTDSRSDEAALISLAFC